MKTPGPEPGGNPRALWCHALGELQSSGASYRGLRRAEPQWSRLNALALRHALALRRLNALALRRRAQAHVLGLVGTFSRQRRGRWRLRAALDGVWLTMGGEGRLAVGEGPGGWQT